MKIVAVALSVLATMFFTTESFSQAPNKMQFQLGYNISAPLDSFKNDYISNTSFNGVTGQIKLCNQPGVFPGPSIWLPGLLSKIWTCRLPHTG